MQIILGINAHHADSSACLIVDGKLIVAIEEERINRKKHFSGFPVESIKACIKQAGVNENEITDIAFNTRPQSNLVAKSLFFFKNSFLNKKNLINRFKKKINLKNFLLKKYNLKKNIKIHLVEHHLSHIASAFFPSGYDDAVGLSIDGSGDFVSLAISMCKNNKIEINKKIYFPDSLGIFYHAMTQFLGFKNYGDEYKVMGMASYGEPKYFNKIKKNLFIDDYNILPKLNLKYFNHHHPNFKYIADKDLIIDNIFNEKLEFLFAHDKEDENNDDVFSKNFAASVQKIYEYYFENLIKKIVKKNFSKNLVFAGGCGLNSSANRILTNNNKYFNDIFIPYAPGDNGGALGAAYVVLSKLDKKPLNASNPYTGLEYSNKYIDEVLNNDNYKDKVNYQFITDDQEICKLASKHISEGNVIGWFQNKMEFGPRALGNRSILADPRNHNMRDIINLKIKRRETFRPFAPSILEQFQDSWLETKFNSPYMSTVGTVKEDKINLVPAITHIDKTARFQSVNSKNNLKFYNLIHEFYKITNVPIVLNTSFNENEPIVMKPEEAIDCLIRTNMDAVFINNFYIKRSMDI